MQPASRSRALAVVGALAVLLPLLSACGDDSEGPSPTTAAPTAAGPTGTAPAATFPALADQRAPDGANGIAVDAEGTLWIAVLRDDEVVRVDPTTGAIIGRWSMPAGSGPDDLVLGTDGVVYVTGFSSGDVLALDPATEDVRVVANVGEGANPIVALDDGRLLVGRAVVATGLFVVDPVTGEVEALDDPGDLNGFAIDPSSGSLVAPRTQPDAALVLVDPETGSVTAEVAALAGIPVAATVGDGIAFVLLLGDGARVDRVALDSGEVTTLADTTMALADNVAIGPDGELFVTGFDEPMVTVVAADGTVLRAFTIGG